MLEASRRSFITGLVALVAAPAIVRAGSLMLVNSKLIPDLWFDQESARVGMAQLAQYKYNKDRRSIDVLYGRKQISGNVFFPGDAWDKAWVVVLPDAFVSDERWSIVPQLLERQAVINTQHEVRAPDSLALAAAAVAIAPVVLAKPMTRRFWGK